MDSDDFFYASVEDFTQQSLVKSRYLRQRNAKKIYFS